MGTARRHKVALVGLGTMGQLHARVLTGLRERFEVVGAYDLREEARAPADVPRLASETEVVACADVVVVATPIGAHAGTVTRALAGGRHVLVEKPLCATADDARALTAAAARGGGRLFVGHSERFNPVVRALARLVGSARGDRAVAVDLRRVGPSRPSECGVLVNLGVHDFDLAAYLCGGDVVLHSALGGNDMAHVLFRTTQGAVGHLHVDRTVTERRRSIALATTGWIYEGDLLAHRLVRTARATGARTDVPLPLEEPLVAQAIALADALDGSSPREIALAGDGAHAVVLAESATTLCAARTAEKLSALSHP